MLSKLIKLLTGLFFALAFLLILEPNAIAAPPAAPFAANAGTAIQFNGSSQYVTFGSSQGLTNLGAQVFTVETWFKKTGAGATTSTGTGGLSAAIPLVTKGRGENENSTVDMNYFFGIDASGVLAADFEECAKTQTGCPATTSNATQGGQNFPVRGTTLIQNDVWYHAAVTFDGRYWKIYLNGDLESMTGTDTGANRYPRWDSIQHAGIGTAMTSTGAAAGFFAGVIDEARIWNVVRTQTDIQNDMYNELTAGTGLIGRWGLNEGTGTTASNSISGRPNGTLAPAAPPPTWVTGFPLPDLTPPAVPQGLTAATGSGQIILNWTANTESDLAGYNLYRSTSTPVPTTGTPINDAALITGTTFTDPCPSPGTNYYALVALDTSNNPSNPSSEANATLATATCGLQFDGTNDYVTFEVGNTLAAPAYTIETWFKRTGSGVGVTTGTGGITSAIPLVTKGTSESETAAADINYFLGIDATTGVLIADFEEGAAGAAPSQNHPVSGSTLLSNNIWYHAAVTYDGTTLRLYLNGVQENSLTVGQPAASATTSPTAFASSIRSNGTTIQGYFNGVIDEARIWNYARTQAEIQGLANQEITSAAGMLGRWGMNEGSGTKLGNSAGQIIIGTLTNGPLWVPGAPFNIVVSLPDAPSGLNTAASGANQVDLVWNDNSNNETSFEIERSTGGAGGPFSLLATVAAGTNAYPDSGLTASTEYCYRVRAKNGFGVSAYTDVACATTLLESNYALGLGSSGAYVTFGDPAELDLAQFTIETWFKRTGAGTTSTTGSSGITAAIPLVAHGAQQADGSNVDANWMLVIDDATDVIAADFEDNETGLNHPILGITQIANNVWHHAAATYDGTTWRLYLDGQLEATLVVNKAPRSDTIQHAGLGSMLNSTGAVNGKFDGVLDEARVWNYARSQAEIENNINSQLALGQSGLVARWGLNEGSGTSVGDSIPASSDGTVSGSGYSWVTGAPFNLAINHAPAQPSGPSPVHGASDVSQNPTIGVTVNDPDSDNLTVSFYGRAPTNPPLGADFTLIALPDTQYYASSLNGGSPAIFNSQTQWIVDSIGTRNIAFVTQLGDCTEHGDQFQVEWQNADAAFQTIENPTTTGMSNGMPYGIAPGNHDQTPIGNPTNSTTLYNQYFGISRFAGRGYYGGHYGTNNDNHYELFSAGGLSFIVIHLEYDTSANADVLAWAEGLLQTHSNRRAIIVSHNLLGSGTNASFSAQGQATYDALKDNPNLFLMLAGHVPGEGRRQDTFNGRTVYTLMSDYQSRTNGGNGWLRILEFSPANNQIRVKTYSPWLNQNESDADSEFTLAYDMGGGANLPTAKQKDSARILAPDAPDAFELIGTNTNVPAGTTTSITWQNLAAQTTHEWYVTVSDGKTTTTGAVSSFTTGGNPTLSAIVSFTGKRGANGIRLDWATGTELNLIGFNILRSTGTDENYSRINPQLVPNEHPGQLTGAEYRYIDNNATPDTMYKYKLQIVGTNDASEEYGPIQVQAAPQVCNATPQLMEPKNKAQITTRQITLDWNDVTCAKRYQLELRRDGAQGELVAGPKRLRGSEFSATKLERGEKYFWRVRACSKGGCSDWTKYRSFVVAKQ